MLAKAEAALLAAIEIYNKPDFKYREETFAILMLNAWELLIKAKAVADNANDIRCIWVREARTLKNGTQSAKAYVKLGRSGNPITRGFNVHRQRVGPKFDNSTLARREDQSDSSLGD
jgi:hypothetical protein